MTETKKILKKKINTPINSKSTSLKKTTKPNSKSKNSVKKGGDSTNSSNATNENYWSVVENSPKYIYDPDLANKLVATAPKEYAIMLPNGINYNDFRFPTEVKNKINQLLALNRSRLPKKVIDTNDYSGKWSNILGFEPASVLKKDYQHPIVLAKTSVDAYIGQQITTYQSTTLSPYKQNTLIKKSNLSLYTTNRGKDLYNHLMNQNLPEDLAPFRRNYVDVNEVPNGETLVYKVTKCNSMKSLISAFKEAQMHFKLYSSSGYDENGNEISGADVVVKPYMIAPVYIKKGWILSEDKTWYMVFIQGLAKGQTLRQAGGWEGEVNRSSINRMMNILWSLGFIHGDLHGENIMYDKKTNTSMLIDLESTVQVPNKYRDAYKKAVKKQNSAIAYNANATVSVSVTSNAKTNANATNYPNRMDDALEEQRMLAFNKTDVAYDTAYVNTLRDIANVLGRLQELWINVQMHDASNTQFKDDRVDAYYGK